MALVTGNSRSRTLDKMAQVVHLAAFALRIIPYFEYVESHANWADEISREGLRGRWAVDRKFHLGLCETYLELMDLPCRAVVKVFECL